MKWRPIAILFAAVLNVPLTVPVHAQSAGPNYRLGYLTANTARSVFMRLGAFREGLKALGYVEGKDYTIDQRHAGGDRNRLGELAAELVRRRVHLILTNGGSATLAAGRAIEKVEPPIPVVFALAADPVGTGLVASFARPGGHITGLTNSHGELVPKRLELLRELLPRIKRVAVIWSPRTRNGPPQMRDLRSAARGLGVSLISVPLLSADGLEGAFSAVKEAGAEAIYVFSWSLSSQLRQPIAERARDLGVPTIHASASHVVAGGMISYGVDVHDLYRRAASYVHKILKGAKPADLPVERPTQFDLIVNLGTARKLGVSVPPTILLRATEVIE